MPLEGDLARGLEALESITAGDGHGRQELRELPLPRRDETLGYLSRLPDLQHRVQAADRRI